MISRTSGYILEVTVADGRPHVRVSFPDGTVIVDTDKVSVTGLEKLPAIFETAASMALRELEDYYRTRELAERQNPNS